MAACGSHCPQVKHGIRLMVKHMVESAEQVLAQSFDHVIVGGWQVTLL
jgi:hypothetical protein